MMVRVSFPNGVREVPAYVSSDCLADDRARMTILKPEPIDGWQFKRVIGGSIEWIAIEVGK